LNTRSKPLTTLVPTKFVKYNTLDDDNNKETIINAQNSGGNFKDEYVDRLTKAMVWKPAIPITADEGLHIGHSKSLWNPNTSPFIFGIRHGISIINLEHTLIYLRRACKVTREISYRGGIILFVNTRGGGFARATINAAKRCKQFQLTTRWLPGTITNSQQILGHLMPKEPEELLPKVFKPDLIILLNPLENAIVLEEAKHGNVPTIGIVDTDFDPRKVSWPIPANDDSVRGVELIAGVLSVAARDGLIQRRKMMEKMESQKIKNKSIIVKVTSKEN
ncbi:4815_t:CDS:2, partial [Dentiscutata heterogama]